MTKKQKTIILSTVVPLGIAAIIPGLSIAISKTITDNSSKISNNNNNKYSFENQTFESKEKLLEYAEDNVVYKEQNVSTPLYFNIKNDPSVNRKDSKDEIDKYIYGKINTYDYKSSKDIETNYIGEIKDDDIKFIHEKNDNNIIEVFRGRNDSIHLSSNAAKDTYLEKKKIYCYKDIYFNSLDELSQYLEDNQADWYLNPVLDAIVIKAPNGQKSQPIQLKDLQEAEDKVDENGNTIINTTKKRIIDFIKANCIDNIEYKKPLANGNYEKIYYDQNKIQSFLTNSSYSPHFVKINSNDGKGSYVVDTYKNDNGELNGPYFVQAASSMKDIKNFDTWRETQNQDRVKSYSNDRTTIISEWFNTIFEAGEKPVDEKTVENSKNIFFTVMDSELQTKIDNYYYELNQKYSEVYSHIVSTFSNIQQGKRYGSFYKIPILYALTIDQLVYWGAYQDMIDKTINIYEEICDFYNSIIYSKVPHNYLKEKTLGEKAMFSLKKILGIGDKTLDINYDMEYLVTKIYDDYPNMFKVSKASPIFTMMAQQLGDTNNMPLDFDVLRENYNLEIDKSDEVWYQSMFWAESTKDYKLASTITSFYTLKNENADEWDFLGSSNSLSPMSYVSINNEWIKSLVINEAIRYSLTGNSDLYTEKQLEFIESLGFMIPKSSEYKFDYFKHKANLEYMKQLYNLNDRNIENIFYIILAIFNNISNDTLINIFGEPKKYDDLEYREKIFSKFWKEIASDSEKLVKETDNVFTMEMSSIGFNARYFDFCPWFDELKGKDDKNGKNELAAPNENIQTVKEFPYANLNNNSSSDLKIQPAKKEWDGKPFLELKENKDKKLKISIPDPNIYLKPYNLYKIDSEKKLNEKSLSLIKENLGDLLDLYYVGYFINSTKSVMRVVNIEVSREAYEEIARILIGNQVNNFPLFPNELSLGNIIEATRYARISTNNVNLKQAFSLIEANSVYMVNEISKLKNEVNRTLQGVRGNANSINDLRQSLNNLSQRVDQILVNNGAIPNNGGNANIDYDGVWNNLKPRVKAEINDAIRLNNERQSAINQSLSERISALEAKKPSKLERVFNMIGTAMTFIQAIFSLVQFILVMNWTRTPVSYTYNSGDVSLIWDGGYRETRFYGLIKGDEQKIEVDKIITPIPIVKASNRDGYYYNGYIYSNVDDLRYEQVRDILKGKYKPNDIKTVYSFKDITNQSSMDRTYVQDTKEELANQVFTDLKKWADEKKTNNNAVKPSFVIEHSYKGDNGIYQIIVNDLPGTISNIKQKIKPVLIAYKPILDSNNYPIYDYEKEEDKSLPEFSLPYKTWSKKDNKIIEKPTTLGHVLVNPNNPKWEENDAELETNLDVEDKLKKEFYDSFDVPSKKVFKTDLDNINKFSKIQNSIDNYSIHEAIGLNGEIKYFKYKQDAYDWVWNSYGVEAVLEKQNKSVYVYKNRKMFFSKQEYLNWIFQNMEIIPWTENKKEY